MRYYRGQCAIRAIALLIANTAAYVPDGRPNSANVIRKSVLEMWKYSYHITPQRYQCEPQRCMCCSSVYNIWFSTKFNLIHLPSSTFIRRRLKIVFDTDSPTHKSLFVQDSTLHKNELGKDSR